MQQSAIGGFDQGPLAGIILATRLPMTCGSCSPELITDAKFEDFKLHIEFNCAPKSNSGVDLRGRYEVQIEDDLVPERPTMRTGGVYGFLAPSPEQPRRPGDWQTYDNTLVGRVVTIVQNGQIIIDKQEIPGITGGALDSHEGLPGVSVTRVGFSTGDSVTAAK